MNSQNKAQIKGEASTMNMKKIALVMTILFTMILASCAAGSGSGSSSKAAGSSSTSSSSAAGSSSTANASTKVAGGALKDGTYTLKETGFDTHGWKVQFSIKVANGKITKSDYNYVNKQGQLKSKNAAYEKAMKAKSGVGPKEYIPKLNQALVAAQDAKQVAVVSGATESSSTFINYAQQLIQAAQKGDTTPITVNAEGKLKDGVYKLAEKNFDSHGWKQYINMTVKGGKITKVDYNFLDKNGKKKSENAGYEKAMKAKSGVGPKEYIPALEKSLVKSQNAAGVSAVSGATESTEAFKAYAAQLINAAQKGDTTPIKVDNLVFKEK
jgi:major membrane immunogen (membrane-anchored lipoprotein)